MKFLQRFFMGGIMIGLFTTFFLVGCQQNTSSSSNQTSAATPTQKSSELYKGEITIGHVIFPGYAPLIIADEKGFFKEAGLNVTLKPYEDLSELSKDYSAGTMQGRANLTIEAVNEKLSGVDNNIVLVQDYSNGADAVIAGPSIQKFEDIKGKKVGFPKGFLEEFLLTWALKEHKLTLNDIIAVNEESAPLIEKMKNGQLDALVTYEPFLSQLLKENPKLHIIYSSGNAPALITDVLTFHKDFIDKEPATIKALTQAYFKGVNYLQENPDESYKILAKRFNQTDDEVKASLKKIVILDHIANQSAFNENDNIQSVFENIKNVYKFLKGTDPSDDFVRSLLNTTFI